MQRFCSIFSQLLQLFPRLEFEQAVGGQFVAMLFCQLGQAHSWREICGRLAATEGKLKHTWACRRRPSAPPSPMPTGKHFPIQE